MFPIEKYKIHEYTDKNTGARAVVAISTYAGKTVKGVAKCDPRDEYTVQDGRALATLRCAEKIAKKRIARAKRKVAAASRQKATAEAHLSNMVRYQSDSEAELASIQDKLADVLSRM